jgi:hypothetical protein
MSVRVRPPAPETLLTKVAFSLLLVALIDIVAVSLWSNVGSVSERHCY